ncbi:hypothetical protein DMH27_26465 [Raoultella planticola]|nr:hypothetical protein [Raoultella planticola]
MYGSIDIQSGATSTETANTSIGGNVSFQPKSADDYLRPGKPAPSATGAATTLPTAAGITA